jgi:predicted ATPase
MLREMTEALVSLTSDRLLVLVIEDLHWADYWTLDLVAALAEHREAARLLLIGTARPLSGREHGRPLKEVRQQLQMHRRCLELPLRCLGPDDVAAYVDARCLPGRLPAEFAHTLYEETEGNPLFMVGVVDDLHAKAKLVHREGHWELAVPLDDLDITVPDHLDEMIALQFERLKPRIRQILEAASVVGNEFSAAVVGAALDEDALPIEEQCEMLARQGRYLRSAGIARKPDGRVTACFRFTHAFYRQVLYDGIQPRLRARWHRSR